MPDKVQILYNGTDAFYPQPTPFVGLTATNIFFNDRWAQQELLSMNGMMTGCTFPAIISAYNNMVGSFAKNYQNLEIWQTQNGVSGRIFLKENVEIQSISVPDNRWIGGMAYNITATCYPSGFFSGTYGILEPSETWTFNEEPDETMSITHNISCRPINTSANASNALDNARTWAFQKTGLASAVLPIFISGVSPQNYFMASQTETIDRMNGTYSVVENYTNDLTRSGYGTIRYTADVVSGNELITLSLRGAAQGESNNLPLVRAAFSNIDIPAVAAKSYANIFNQANLNPIPLSKSFAEDAFNGRINFEYVFNNDTSPPIVFDYDVNLDVGTNGRITATINGTIKVKGGTLSEKLAAALAYAQTIDLYGYILPFYYNFDVSSLTPLNNVPLSYAKTIRQTDGVVELSAKYDNRTKYDQVLDEFEPTISFIPSYVRVDSQPKLDGNGNYSVVNLGYGSRPIITIQGYARVNSLYSYQQGVQSIKNQCFALLIQYGRAGGAILEKNYVSRNRTDDKVIDFEFTWSINEFNRIGPSSIGSLSV